MRVWDGLFIVWSDDWLSDKRGEIELIKSKINNLLLSAPDWVRPKGKFEEVEEETGIPEFDPSEIYPEYKVAILPFVNIDLEFDSYGDLKWYRKEIERVFSEVLEIESPMTTDRLYRRVNYVIGVGRMGTRIKKLYEGILRKRINGRTAYKRGETVSNKPIPKLVPIRISTEQERSFLSIPIEELANASMILIENMGAISEKHLSKNVARLFYDNTRSGKKIMNKMKKVFGYLESKGYIERDSDNLIIKNS